MNSIIPNLRQMLILQVHYQTRLDYLNWHVNISSREKLLVWISQVIEQEHQSISVFHLSAHLFDQLLSILDKSNYLVDKSMLQLIGTSCLFIASKLRDIKPLSSIKLIEYCDNMFNLRQLLEYEQFILHSLKWDTESPTPSDYLDIIIDYINRKDLVHYINDVFNTLTVRCKIDQRLSVYSPSTITFSCIQSILKRLNLVETKKCIDDLMIALDLDINEINSLVKVMDTMMPEIKPNTILASNLFYSSAQDLLDLAVFKDFLDEELFIENSIYLNDSDSDKSDLTKSFDDSYNILLTPPAINFHHIQTF